MATYPVGGEWLFKSSEVLFGSWVLFRFVDAEGHILTIDFKRTPKRCSLQECVIYTPTGHTLLVMDKGDTRLKLFGVDKVVKQCRPLGFLMT